MSVARSAIIVILSVFLASAQLRAASLDGTSGIVYKNTLQIFQRGLDQSARGFVRLNQGVALASRTTAFMDVNVSASGPLDLGETGTLVLLGDLYWDHSIVLTSGGNIKGNGTIASTGSTIFLGGDLTLSATTYTRAVHITGEWATSNAPGGLIIDGRGHTLDIQDRAQLFVDQNMTLTLRNMIIRTGPKSFMRPPIQLASLGSKLTLDDVIFDLGADFQFKQGQIFIHDSVAVTGTSAFIYQSSRPSFITSGATWSFELGTTFSMAPVSYTDQAYTAGTATTNNFLVFADASSALYLNGCSLQTTFTGLRLSKGMVLFDNRVTINTQAAMSLATTGTTPIGYFVGFGTGNITRTYQAYAIAWSPDSKFFSVLENTQKTMHLYRFDGIGVPTPLGGSVSLLNDPMWADWSPDSRYIAVAIRSFTGPDARYVQVFRFTGNSTPVLIAVATTSGASPTGAMFSPDGRFIAVCNDNGNTVEVFKFDGVGAIRSLGTVPTGTNPDWVGWSADGRFIAFINANSHQLQVCSFNGRSAPVSLGTVGAGSVPRCCAWSPDGRFIAVAGHSLLLYVYTFNGSSLPSVIGAGTSTGSLPLSVTWSPDGRYIAVANNGDNNIQVYSFDGKNTPVLLGTFPCGAAPHKVSWSPDGKFIAVYNNATPTTVRIFRCNYVYTGQPTQSFASGLVFGDSAKGSAFNANVKMLRTARVEVVGKVTDDSA
jgi:WD40 repeat protein